MNGYIKRQMVELCDSAVRNINDNFKNISFCVKNNGNITIRIILDVVTEKEYEYIDDFSAEFEAAQDADILENIEITTDPNSKPLLYEIYSRSDNV